jgi:hypothetical protein
MHDHEIIPGVSLGALGLSERLMIGGLRLIAAGRGKCPNLGRAFENHLGSQGSVAAHGAGLLAQGLCSESERKLTLGWMCVRGVTWDEAAILGMLEAAQRSDAPRIARWLSRLGVGSPGPMLQRGIAWSAAAFSVAGKPFDPDVEMLTRAQTSPTSQLREQIETQMGGVAGEAFRRHH